MQGRKIRIPLSIWLLLLLLWGFVLMNSLLFAPRPMRIPYSQFKEMVAEGKVKEVVIGKEAIEGKGVFVDCLLYTSPSPRDRG